ncbi:nicotinate-nucleotide-dimethylbenzimidazole phosphoribosyltransferase [Alkalispirochaeta americana]|uniref:Nicotinate-nucleotide--dimethylbenzimidazole phosphoribosyltransferase n=1 Tax=Alkalispirochaeta americana TaxID=159291 RepID=A0A1N6T399_9SPIO|nr:nicotinate-nucleotide--dimethylbenzimidazole phosphoribosyltransferase [Alkalispirochaeta americana]SIQ47809.1 nicotinate-nucleotide-dimethylbenzimidazole phosphoribosyltransferase [Alkalispirochaeta americana]
MRLVMTGIGQAEMDECPQGALEVEYCGVCRTDGKLYLEGQRDLHLPRVPGHEAVVRDREGGQRFVLWPGIACGNCRDCRQGKEQRCRTIRIMGFHFDGAFASSLDPPRGSSFITIPVPPTEHPELYTFAEPLGCIFHAFDNLRGDERSVLVYGAGTLGLMAWRLARDRGIPAVILERSQEKIDLVARRFPAVPVRKELQNSRYGAVVCACSDYQAFCSGITKLAKGGILLHFSGITKNETVSTNLLNIIHYKELALAGTYGLHPRDMERAVAFIAREEEFFALLVEEVISPEDFPRLARDVYQGTRLKYILQPGRARCGDSFSDPPVGPISCEGSPEQRPGARDILEGQKIFPVSASIRSAARHRMDRKAKPLGALGDLEDLAVQLCAVQNTLDPQVRRKVMVIFAADHGVAEEGVSAYPPEVTARMVDTFARGGAAINVLSRLHGLDLTVVDMGVRGAVASHRKIMNKWIGPGTRNSALQPAMTSRQAMESLKRGREVFLELMDRHGPIDLAGFGEMGIGNTTAASAIIALATGKTAQEVAGRGTGLDDEGLRRKIEVLEKIIALHRGGQEEGPDGLDILRSVGGFEIGGIAGALLAAASARTLVVLDGLISTAAGIIAAMIEPAVKDYIIVSHASVEPGHRAACGFLGVKPLVDLSLRLGEGSGAALAMPLIESAAAVMRDMASLEEAGVVPPGDRARS